MANDAQLSAGGVRVLLLVEWNATLRSGLQDWLHQEFRGYRVETAADREQAERAATQHSPVVAMVNIDAHRGEGLSTLRSLHALVPDAFLVALSLYPVEYFRDAAMHAGAVGCACIAMADDKLRDLVRSLLAPARAVTPGSFPA
ncbi:MAG: hypothetical protein ACYCT1_14775 [Steroidobacteraceae bacterium]